MRREDGLEDKRGGSDTAEPNCARDSMRGNTDKINVKTKIECESRKRGSWRKGDEKAGRILGQQEAGTNAITKIINKDNMKSY